MAMGSTGMVPPGPRGGNGGIPSWWLGWETLCRGWFKVHKKVRPVSGSSRNTVWDHFWKCSFRGDVDPLEGTDLPEVGIKIFHRWDVSWTVGTQASAMLKEDGRAPQMQTMSELATGRASWVYCGNSMRWIW